MYGSINYWSQFEGGNVISTGIMNETLRVSSTAWMNWTDLPQLHRSLTKLTKDISALSTNHTRYALLENTGEEL